MSDWHVETDRELGRSVVRGSHGDARFAVPSVLVGRYRISKTLAVGGFGVLLEAEDLRLFRKRVVVKASRYPSTLFRHPRDKAVKRHVEDQHRRLRLERFMLLEAEQRGLAGTPVLLDAARDVCPTLRGPHRTEDGATFLLPEELWLEEPYLVIQHLDGRTLADACLDAGFRADRLGRTRHILRQLAAILGGFHRPVLDGGVRRSFVYQDLKPENVMRTWDDRLVLIDFGSFAVIEDWVVQPFNARLSTPLYAPPEHSRMLNLEEQVTPRADVYSLGMTVLHLLRGSPPRDEATGAANRSTAGLGLPSAWEEWLARAVAVDPRDRFQTMQDASDAAASLPIGRSP